MKPYKRLNAQHKEVMRQQYMGRSNPEIAESMNRKASWISHVVSNPTYKEYFPQYEALARPSHVEPRARFEGEISKSIDTLVLVRDTAEDMAQRRLASNDLLDRAPGCGRSQKADGIGIQILIGAEKINLLVQAMQESAE